MFPFTNRGSPLGAIPRGLGWALGVEGAAAPSAVEGQFSCFCRAAFVPSYNWDTEQWV